MPSPNTIKEIEKEWMNMMSFELGHDIMGTPENIASWWISKLQSYSDEVRREMVEKIEKLRKNSEKFVPFQKIHYQSALDDILALSTLSPQRD